MWEEQDSIKEKLLRLGKSNGLEPTEFFEKIVKAKERFGLTIGCPCDRENKDRYCISPLCKSDIEKNGTCHCQMWCKTNGQN